MWRFRVPGGDVGFAFRSVGVDVYALNDARRATIAPAGVESFSDFRADRCQGTRQPTGGKMPPGL